MPYSGNDDYFLILLSQRPRPFHVVRYMASPTYRGIFHFHGLAPIGLDQGQKQELIADPSTGDTQCLTPHWSL